MQMPFLENRLLLSVLSWTSLQIDQVNSQVQVHGEWTYEQPLNRMDKHIKQTQIDAVPGHLLSGPE